VLLVPDPQWVKDVLPHGKLPDRADFKAYGERIGERQRDWRRAVAECQRLADELAGLLRRESIEAAPLR
jgi:hypothetical protein